jgi:glycerophosphoryl diester phosphodiesterase
MKPIIIGHRGAAGTYPENTMVSISAALDMGVKWVEIDIQPTKDDVLVVCHDHSIDRCSNGHGRIDSFTYGELLQFDFGGWFDSQFAHERIMTLTQLLKLAVDKDFNINIEVKIDDEHDAKHVVSLLANMLAENAEIIEQVVLSSFETTVLKEIAHQIPSVRIGVLTEYLSDSDIELIKALNPFSCHINYRHLTESQLSTLRDLKVEIWCYTVNRPSTFPLLEQVDAIFTDFPSHFLTQ